MADDTPAKRCGRCGGVKPLTDFYVRRRRGKVSTQSRCKACCKLTAAERNAANPDYGRTQVREWKRRNPERAAEHIREQYRRRKENREVWREYFRQYRQTPTGKASTQRTNRKLKAQRRAVPFTELGIEYADIIVNDPCVYCGAPGGTVDHIQPITRGGSGEWDNLAGACKSCNSKKHNKELLAFLIAS